MECGKTTNPSSDHAAVIVMQKDASTLFDHTFLKPENSTTSFDLLFWATPISSILNNWSVVNFQSMKCVANSHYRNCRPLIIPSACTHLVICNALSVKIGCHCMNHSAQPYFKNQTDCVVPFTSRYISFSLTRIISSVTRCPFSAFRQSTALDNFPIQSIWQELFQAASDTPSPSVSLISILSLVAEFEGIPQVLLLFLFQKSSLRLYHINQPCCTASFSTSRPWLWR